MIGRLNGKLVEKQPPQIVIDVGGVGYEVDVSMQTFYTLPPLGEPVQLFTQLVVSRGGCAFIVRLRLGARARHVSPAGESERHRCQNGAGHFERHERRRSWRTGGGARRCGPPLFCAWHRQEKPPSAWCWNCAGKLRPAADRRPARCLRRRPMKPTISSARFWPWATTSAKPERR